MASNKKNPCQDEFEKKLKKEKELLEKTTDAELGKMYRQHKEASDFFVERGLYV